MGSLPNSSVLKGENKLYDTRMIHRIFEEVAQNQENTKKAIIFEGEDGKKRHVTYLELDNISNKIARFLVDKIKTNRIPANSDGDFVVAVYMAPSEKLIISLLAILKAGCAYLPLDKLFPAVRIKHILTEAKPCLIICDEEFKHDTENVSALNYEDFVTESDEFSPKTLAENEIIKHKKDNLAIILYTSGSTGVPKGVRLPHEAIQNRLQWQFEKFPYSETEHNCVFKTTLTFVDSVSEIWGPLMNGRTLIVIPKKFTQDPEKLIQILDSYKIERLVLVPTLLRSMLLYLEMKNDPALLESLRVWVCSGEPLPVVLAENFYRNFSEKQHKLCNFYGSTEIMGDVTFHVVSSSDKSGSADKIPIGVPLSNTSIHLLDSDLKPVTNKIEERPLELWVSGLNLAAGYVNGRDPDRFIRNPMATQHSFATLYRTGDYAMLKDGVLHYCGRTDTQIKVRGHRVDLSEVEKTVQSVKPVEKAVVLCYHPGDLDQELLAFVTLRQGWLLTELQLENVLSKILAPYMVPQVRIMHEIPLLVNGKVDRQTLLKTYENLNNNNDCSILLDVDYSGVPGNLEEPAKALLESVAAVLGRGARSAVTLKANFYEIGGNSLNSIVTITKLKERGYNIGVSEFINARNLHEVLDAMTRGRTNAEKSDKFTLEMLQEKHKSDVINMITSSFYQKADLEQWLMPDIQKSDYAELIQLIWADLLAQKLSFVVKNPHGKNIGVSLCFDARNEPEVQVETKLKVIFEFLEHVEVPMLNKHLTTDKGKILHNFMMGTHEDLNAQENIEIMQHMEEKCLEVGRKLRYQHTFTTNTSPLTQQLGTDVFGYTTLLDYQVNAFVASDGTKPFGKAPDNARAIVCTKQI